MQRESERDLITAWQQGNLTAARQIVAMLQAEAVNVAYLLTGEHQDAVALAEAGFLALFEHSRSGDPDTDRRVQLLTLMTQSFVRGDYKARIEHIEHGLMLGPAPTRYNVDNRRTLLLAALGRLEPRERAALVLHDFSGLEPSEMSRLVEKRGDPLVAPLAAARVRVRNSLDLDAGEHLRRPFAEATFDAPRVDLWPRIEAPLADIVRRDRNQSRLISASIVTVVVLVLLGGIAALFGDSLLKTGGDEPAGAGTQPTTSPSALAAGPTIAQSIDIPPTSTPNSPSFPASNVPSWLLLETWHQQDEESGAYRSLTVFDPTVNQIRRLPSNSPLHLAAGSNQVRFSPDGYQMVVFREEIINGQIHYFLVSYSTDSIGRQWETEVLVVDHDPDVDPSSHTPARMAAVITRDRVYVATLTTDTEPTLTVQSYFRRNGMPRGSTEIKLPQQTIDTRVFQGNVLLYAPTEGNNLYVIVESFGDSVEEWRAALMTFDRAEMKLIRQRDVSADLSQGYWLWSSQMTRDGTALFGVHQNRSGSESRVQFLELETGEVTTIPLPFTTPVNQGSSGLMPITSHDGQRIFILNQSGSDVAVVNLSERAIERVFPLDRRGFEAMFPSEQQGLMFGYSASLSADGTQLYIASRNQESEDESTQSGIWVVDTGLWKLTHFIPVEGLVNGIFLSPTENAMYAQIWTANDAEPIHEVVKIATGSNPKIVDTLDLPQRGDDYVWTQTPSQYFRTQFGHSPAIDYVQLSDSTNFSTLPRIEVTSGPDVIVPGHSASIEVRVLDPESGVPLASERSDVRFDPAAGVTAFVHAPDQERQIAILGEVSPGVYRGSVVLSTEGQWTVDVALTDSSGEPWVAERAGRIDVAPVFTGSDGRAYVFRVTTDPSTPVVDEETLVRLTFIDAETGEPKPDDVEVTIELDDGESAGLPDRIDIPFMHAEPGYLTARMDRTSSGTYEGTVRFWATGAWSAFIRIQIADQPQIMIPANRVEVSEPG